MTKDWNEIVTQIVLRQSDDDNLKRHMIEVRDRYNGAADGFILPLPGDIEREQYDPLIPTLVSESIDQLAMRAGSTLPGVVCPPLRAGKESGVKSKQYATIRETAIYDCWERSRFGLGLRRMYRHLAGYASMTAAVMPDQQIGMPRVKVMDPLSAYPEPQSSEDLADPMNCAFVYGKSAEWVRANYPTAMRENGGPVAEADNNWNQLWDFAFWVDETEWVWGLLGPRPGINTQPGLTGQGIMELGRATHGLSQAPFVIANKVTMDKVISQIVNVTGLIDLKARLMNLQLAAAERAVFPDKYIMGDEHANVVVNGGSNKWLDGRAEGVNIILGARAVGNLHSTPDQAAMQLADRFERDYRISTGLTPQTGGETYGALRTGRGIDTLQAEAVDPRVHELQAVAENHLPALNRAILETFEKQYGRKTFWLFPGQAGDTDATEFMPNKHVEKNYVNRVRYAITGAGVEATNIIVQQMVGSGLISRETARELHPYIRGNHERSRITTEQLEDGTLNGILQQLATGGMPPIMVAYIEEELSSDPTIDIFEGLRRADKKMRELQAQQQAEQPDPAAQPGIAPGAPAGPAQPPPGAAGVIGPQSGTQGLQQLNQAISSANQVVGQR